MKGKIPASGSSSQHSFERSNHWSDGRFQQFDYSYVEQPFLSSRNWIIILSVAVVVILVFLLTIVNPEALWKETEDQSVDPWLSHWEKYSGLHICAFIGSFLTALLVGFTCGGYAWLMVYFDSLDPGICPPTPLSPRRLKEASGHAIHINYGMCMLYGFAMVLITLWYLQDKYLLSQDEN